MKEVVIVEFETDQKGFGRISKALSENNAIVTKLDTRIEK
jgi:hypothetical protein